MGMVVLTRRTDFPKLGWLLKALEEFDVFSAFAGHSYHAPILTVDKEKEELCWRILNPVDELEDDDPAFIAYSSPWWAHGVMEAKTASFCMALGLLLLELGQDGHRFPRLPHFLVGLGAQPAKIGNEPGYKRFARLVSAVDGDESRLLGLISYIDDGLTKSLGKEILVLSKLSPVDMFSRIEALRSVDPSLN